MTSQDPDSSGWIMDTGVTDHVHSDACILKSMSNNHDTHSIYVGDGSSIPALEDPHWHKAMDEEYHALTANGTWELVPRPSGANVVRSMWLFKNKFHADGSLGSSTTYLLLYVDDIILTASSTSLLHTIIGQLNSEFSMTNLGALNYFLGPHFLALKRISRYLRGTLNHGLLIHALSLDGLIAYSDADWGGCPTTRRSTFGCCVFQDENLYHGPRNISRLYRDLVLRQNIVVSLTLLLKFVGYAIFFESFTLIRQRPP
ncbi:uncharacterized protein [Rutidosis leptorrhynchoides]|uniref:uncharacterized protein n=1 Tax=Rutidosis leptorrhynchoides TaxID=125765 RepID=UPI003A99C07A